MEKALLQNLMAGAGSSSQFIGGVIVTLLYAFLSFDDYSKDDGNKYSGPLSSS
jgi:hypothetical protein